MSALTQTTAKNRSGVVGVSRIKRLQKYVNGREVMRYFWAALCGRRRVRFSVDSLGDREAFREAVRTRAAWVRAKAPAELARKRAKYRRNMETYRKRYPELEARRIKQYQDSHRDQINARRRRRRAATRKGGVQ